VIWSTVGSILGTSLCLISPWQAAAWFYSLLPGGDGFHMMCCGWLKFEKETNWLEGAEHVRFRPLNPNMKKGANVMLLD
jgi:hypothetical protein